MDRSVFADARKTTSPETAVSVGYIPVFMNADAANFICAVWTRAQQHNSVFTCSINYTNVFVCDECPTGNKRRGCFFP
jgi:hypothetical protein